MEYRDFNVRFLVRRGDGYDVSIESPAGSVRAHITVDADQVARDVLQFGAPVRGDVSRDAEFEIAATATPKAIGAALYEALFPGDVRSLYDRSCGKIFDDPNLGLRIKLYLNPNDPDTGALAQLPWELIYDASRDDFLALRDLTPLVRYVEVPRALRTHTLEGRLRILVVMSSPHGHAALDLNKERKLIESSLAAESSVEVEYLEQPTPQALRRRLLDSQFHVLHYMGHGAHDAVTGMGALVLNDDDGNAALLTSETIGSWLGDARSLRLICLNACDTGKASVREPFSGIANRLVWVGLPAVLAMQRPISDTAAIEFSRAFYARLASGHAVDDAATQGRKAIKQFDNGRGEWSTPVLFLQGDGRLFDKSGMAPEVRQSAPLERPSQAVDVWFVRSVFFATAFALVTVLSAYRTVLKSAAVGAPGLPELATIGPWAMVAGVSSVVLFMGFFFASLDRASEPGRSALRVAIVATLGVHAALIVGPLVWVVASAQTPADYSMTLFCGVTVVCISLVFLVFHLRDAGWVGAAAPPAAVTLILCQLLVLAIQFASARSGDIYWSDRAFGFQRQLVVTVALCAVAIAGTYLAAARKFANQPDG